MPQIHPEDIAARLGALPGVERLRDAAGDEPVHLVGGAVRDLLLDRPRTDIDLVVEGDVAELARRLGGAIRAHARFATASVDVDGLQVDLATARSETYPAPGALPDVLPADLAGDLARRDFTVNAMALPLSGDVRLIDPHGGAVDLEQGLLRVLHERSFADDPTRALRAARYASRLGFELEPAPRELVRGADLESLSRDRVEAELRRFAREPAPARPFQLAESWELWRLPAGAASLIERIAALDDEWRAVADPADAILAAAAGRTAAAESLASAAPAGPSEAVRIAHGHTPAELTLARAMGADWLDRYVSEWRHVRLAISGDDLLDAGIPEGPALGRGLQAALRAKLDGHAADRGEELRLALEAARAS